MAQTSTLYDTSTGQLKRPSSALKIPSGCTLSIESGASIVADAGSTVTGFGSGGGGTPAGSSGDLQYNNAGSFGGYTPGAGVVTFLQTPSGANLAAALTTALPATKGGTGLTSLGTGVATALGVNVGSAGAFVAFNGALGTPSSGTLTSCTGLPVSTGISGLGTGIATALAVNTGSAGAPVLFNGALGTPSSGTLTNCTFPTLNQSTTGSAATLTTARAIYGNNFDGSAALTQVIASTYGGTGNGFTKFSGPTTAERTKTLRDATDTILELGGSYTPTGTWTSLTLVTPVLGTPASGTLTSCTGLPITGITSSTSAQLRTLLSDENGTGVALFDAATSPSFTTSLTTGSTTFALLNATATTVNAFGAATTLNIGASATCILNFGGSTTASEFRFLEPSGSGTNYTAFKAQAQSANITYTLPAADGSNTNVLQTNGSGVLSWVAAGSGTVTVVAAGSLTSTALVTGGGTTTLQTPSATATMDTSGNISTPGTLTVGNAASTAGAVVLTQGTTQSTGTTNITIQAPTSVTSYIITAPGAVGSTGLVQWTVSGSVATLSSVTTLPSGITLVAPVLGTPASGTLTNCTGLPIGSLVAGTLAGTMTLAENVSIALDPAGSADGKYTGITVTGTGGATIAFGDLVTLDKDDSRWEPVDISVAAAATGDARGILGMAVTSSTDGGALTVLLQGIIRADANFPALTIGAAVFASTTGDIVVTQPTTTDHVIRIIGHALTADEIHFKPDAVWTTHT